jgi:ABC-type amino acid transport substrate-binding protein
VFTRSRARSVLLATLVVASCATACTPKTASANCSGSSPVLRQRGTLTVAADLTYPPFAYDRPGKEPAGFEADLLRAIAKALKMDLLVVNRATSALVPGLLGHRHDVAAAGLLDTDELREQTCVSTSYLTADLALVVPKPDPRAVEGPDDLDGRRVGVLRGSRAEDWVREHMGGSDIRTMPADADLIEALAERTVDGVVEELAVARYATTQAKDLQVTSVIETGRSYVMATATDNGALMKRLDRAVAKLEANGKLAKIRAKWFGH